MTEGPQGPLSAQPVFEPLSEAEAERVRAAVRARYGDDEPVDPPDPEG